jgi:hypothetical protein
VSLKAFLDDLEWALMMRRVRAYRRTLTFTQCKKFDYWLRPPVDEFMVKIVEYPHAFYVANEEDVDRATKESKR